jgi:signal transduction histidine kinase
MQQEYVSIIEVRMLNINDIVDISKIEAVNVQQVNINKQIEFIYTFFKPQIRKKVHLIMKIFYLKEKLYKFRQWKNLFYLTNLVKNAIKFTDQGTIELGYTLKSEKDSSVLEFYVKDMGIGIPKIDR